MRRQRKDYMREALQYVINCDGMAQEPWTCYVESMRKAWDRAKQLGYLRPVTEEEVLANLTNRRSVREVLLGMLERALGDELTRRGWDISDYGDQLESVADDIQILRGNARSLWTLTEAGVTRLEGEEAQHG